MLLNPPRKSHSFIEGRKGKERKGGEHISNTSVYGLSKEGEELDGSSENETRCSRWSSRSVERAL